ncbi:MAG: endonuclease III [Candidatus Bipolaricaulota bacterium]|nr:endonuclease III [Candidatus Bipolaricaulota bacterium]
MQAELLAEIDRRLRQAFGDPPRPPFEPLELLIRTILSQNTSDRNRDRAYAALRARFPRWEDLLSASEAEVAAAIRPAGLYRQRARRLREVLRRIQEAQGELSLAFLGRLPPDEAEAWLLSLPGVGKKTAYIVLLFAFGHERFPVDTHIARVARRVGLWAGRGDPHAALAPFVPRGRAYPLHLNLIRLGREVCRPRAPRCPQCPLRDLCAYAQRREDDTG